MTSKIAALDRLRPESFKYLVDISKDPSLFDEKKLREYVYYYQKVNDYSGGRADAYGMLGLCYYHLKDYKKAIDAYTKAAQDTPQFFWFHYNPGLIYFKQGQFKEAGENFKKALATNPVHAVVFISRSKLYVPLIQDKTIQETIVLENVQRAFKDCERLMVLSYQMDALKKEDRKPVPVVEKLTPQIF